MDLTESRYLKIRFNDGSERNFAFEPLTASTDAANIMSRVNTMLDSKRIILQLPDRITIIPFDNVQAIEVFNPNATVSEAVNVIHEFN